jgi:transposase InsO family protein
VKNKVPVEGVGADLLKVEGIGKVTLLCETEEGVTGIILEDVKYTPGADVNLASLSKFLNKGAVLHGEGKALELQMDGENFLRAENQGDLMVIQTVNQESKAFVAADKGRPELWHKRFCHAGYETLAKMVQDDLVEGMPVSAEQFRKVKQTVCEPCVLGKQTRKPFPSSKRESTGPMELIHTDVCGPMETKTPGGNRYFVSFIDDYSRCAVIQLLQNKNQVKTALSAFVSTMENQFDTKIKKLQSDRGGEFWNKDVKEFCANKGIVHQKTNPYSSQENGIAERLNRTLMEKTRAMIQGSELGDEYWGEALLTASHVRNRTVSQVHGKTPLEMLTGKKPQVNNLRVFGSTAFVHVPSQRRQKLDAVAKKAVFLGYEANTKGYRIMRKRDKRVVVSKDVTFQEEEIRADSSGDFLKDEDRERPLALPGPTTSGSGSCEDPQIPREREKSRRRRIREAGTRF